MTYEDIRTKTRAGDDFNEIFPSEKNHPSKRSNATLARYRSKTGAATPIVGSILNCTKPTIAAINGVSRAMELLLSGELIGADEALRIGIVSRVVPHEKLESAATELVEKLSWSAPLAQRAIKRTVQKGLSMHWDELEEFGRMLSDERWRTEDHREGVASHVEKRKPKFTER
jgi:enoyl-CoA hydratase/carnithine racemase